MGYLKIDTENSGEVIVNAANVLYVKMGGYGIDFIIDLGPSADRAEIRLSVNGVTESTKQKFNAAVIAAQSENEIIVRPSENEEFVSISLDPA